MVTKDHGRQRVFYTPDNVLSYAMARLKIDVLQRRESDQQLKAKLREGGEHHDRVVEGGTWWRFVEMDKAKRDGDIERLTALTADAEQDTMQRVTASLAKFATKPVAV